VARGLAKKVQRGGEVIGPPKISVRPLGYATAFGAYLDAGERLLWVGQPRQGIFLRASDAGLIPFSLLWGGFAIFWEATVLTSMLHGKKAPLLVQIIFPAFGAPFVLIGLYFMFGRFFFDAWLRRRIWYGVTDRRALIVRVGRNSSVKSFELRGIGEVGFQQHADGTGSLTFGAAASTPRGRGFNFQSVQNNAFDHTPDANEAYRIVRQVQEALAARVGC
jgi:hypothetical protein